MKQEITNWLRSLKACDEARIWVADQEDWHAAWNTCERGEWLIWLCGRLSGPPDSDSRRKLIGCAAECAALALPVWKAAYPDDKRVDECLDTCRAYAAGSTDLKTVHAAAHAAYVAHAETESYASYVPFAANSAANAASSALAADAAADAAAWAAAATRETTTLSQCADIVRKHYPRAPVREIRGGKE